MKRALLILAAALAAAIATAAPAMADPYQPGVPYDPTGCVANPQLPCGPDGNPLVPFWHDSPNGPIIDPGCAALNTCVPGEIAP
ncbi:MAG TPA: hypothetical protein VFR27_03100 [Mycobacterium sp.]|nr:hypothetical protein [Mycobacterium sp.]